MTDNIPISEDLIKSPCIRDCCLDSNDICLGCWRHIDEIIAWQSYSREEKTQVIHACQTRKKSKPV
jgi:predicted Fe-S protein YdhL (DUF1289 family)